MRLHEVLEEIEGDGSYWFRPVSWKNSVQAYVIKHSEVYLVPDPHGGRCGITSDAELLAGDWEIVTPDEVLD